MAGRNQISLYIYFFFVKLAPSSKPLNHGYDVQFWTCLTNNFDIARSVASHSSRVTTALQRGSPSMSQQFPISKTPGDDWCIYRAFTHIYTKYIYSQLVYNDIRYIYISLDIYDIRSSDYASCSPNPNILRWGSSDHPLRLGCSSGTPPWMSGTVARSVSYGRFVRGYRQQNMAWDGLIWIDLWYNCIQF